MASYTLINPDGSRQTVQYRPKQDGPVSQRLVLVNKLRWLENKARKTPLTGFLRRQIVQAQRRLSAFDNSLSRPKPRTRQPVSKGGRPPASAYDRPAVKQGHRDQPGSGSIDREKTSCKAAASLTGSSVSQTGLTSHTPSIFAAPTQSLYTADAGGSEAMPVNSESN